MVEMACCAPVSRTSAGLCLQSVAGGVASPSSHRQNLCFPPASKVAPLRSASAFSRIEGFAVTGPTLTRCGSLSLGARAAKSAEELKEIRNLSDDEIKSNVQDLKGELFILRAMQATRQEFKSSEFRRIRKRVCFQYTGFPFPLSVLIRIFSCPCFRWLPLALHCRLLACSQ